MAFEVRVLSKIDEVPSHAWDALHNDNDSPFVQWRWLDALERAGCAVAARGWQPAHLTAWRDGQLVMAAPAYVKSHSEGEFVFDWAWASAAERAGLSYYPKLVVAVPFTPATGARLLRAPGVSLDEAAEWLVQSSIAVAKKLGLSSVHVLFPHREEAEALERAGFAVRVGVQFHWRNEDYRTMDDFLARFQSKKRNAIKRERSQVARDAMTVTTHTGDAITPALIDPMFAFYAVTVDKFFYGRRYLNKAFFTRVQETFRDSLEWVIAREQDGTPVAGAFNVARGKKLFGRYWGATEEKDFLHFNVCFYHGIERCIETGRTLFEPGAGGEHKLVRGFEPSLTYSAHWIEHRQFDRTVRDFLQRETVAVNTAVARELEESPIRRKG